MKECCKKLNMRKEHVTLYIMEDLEKGDEYAVIEFSM